MYYLSITDNPSLFGQMYFGPGQKVERNQELWHGNIWKESPQFGQASIQINGSMLYNILFVYFALNLKNNKTIVLKIMIIFINIIILATYNCGDFIIYKDLITRKKFGRILAIVKVNGELKTTIQCI